MPALVLEIEESTVKPLETYMVVAVALAARNVLTVVEAKVDEALDKKPPINSMMVEVACSSPACLVNGQAKLPPPPQPEQEPTVRAPIVAILALSWLVVATLGMETVPPVLILKAETVDVAKVVAEEVARYKKPSIFLKLQ